MELEFAGSFPNCTMSTKHQLEASSLWTQTTFTKEMYIKNSVKVRFTLKVTLLKFYGSRV